MTRPDRPLRGHRDDAVAAGRRRGGRRAAHPSRRLRAGRVRRAADPADPRVRLPRAARQDRASNESTFAEGLLDWVAYVFHEQWAGKLDVELAPAARRTPRSCAPCSAGEPTARRGAHAGSATRPPRRSAPGSRSAAARPSREQAGRRAARRPAQPGGSLAGRQGPLRLPARLAAAARARAGLLRWEDGRVPASAVLDLVADRERVGHAWCTA